MKKPFKHTEMTKERCVECGKAIKANVVARSPKGKVFRCYKHAYALRMALRNHNTEGRATA